MLKKSLILAGFLALSAGNVNADALGTWKTQKGETGASAIVKIYKCGSKYCGRITRVIGGDQSTVGTVLIKGMSKNGKKYSGGTIYAPDTQKTYKSKMTEIGSSKLKVEGCVAVFCRKQIWRRQ